MFINNMTKKWLKFCKNDPAISIKGCGSTPVKMVFGQVASTLARIHSLSSSQFLPNLSVSLVNMKKKMLTNYVLSNIKNCPKIYNIDGADSTVIRLCMYIP